MFARVSDAGLTRCRFTWRSEPVALDASLPFRADNGPTCDTEMPNSAAVSVGASDADSTPG